MATAIHAGELRSALLCGGEALAMGEFDIVGTIVGVVDDPSFGPAVMFGLGGTTAGLWGPRLLGHRARRPAACPRRVYKVQPVGCRGPL